MTDRIQRITDGILISYGRNEYGTRVSEHVCLRCGGTFTVCPAYAEEDWGGCLEPTCETYDPSRDADKLFDEGNEWMIQREEGPDE